MLDEVRVAERRHRHLLLVHQLLVDARRLAVREHFRRDVQRIRVGVPVVGDVIGDDHRRQRPRLLQGDALLFRLRRLLRDVARHFAEGLRHAAHVVVHQLQRLGRIEIAHEHQRRVRRHVERPVEVAHIVDRRGLEILQAADRRVLVRMHGERLVVDDLIQASVRLIVDAHPALFLHDLALALERVLVDPQRRHAVGFHPQHQRQVVRRHRFPEHRLVVGRVGVALAADRRQHRCVRFGLDVLGALEHQVLEEMREPGAARLLVLRPDVIHDLQVHDRRRVVLRQHYREPVRQRRDLVLQFRRTRGRGRRQGRGVRHAASRQSCGE